MTTSTAKGVPYPVDGDPPDVPKDMGNLATWNDTNPGVGVMTTAQRDALPAAQKWVGRVIYNTTTVTHEGYNGTAWVPIGAGVQVMTTAQRDALTAAQKTTGMIIFNTTLGAHQMLNTSNQWAYLLQVPARTQSQITGEPLTNWGAQNGNGMVYDVNTGAHRFNLGLSFPLVGNIPPMTQANRDAYMAAGSSIFLRGYEIIYNTTTARYEWYDAVSAKWRALNPYTSGAYGLMGSAALPNTTSPTNSTSPITVASVTFTGVAGRVYLIDVSAVVYANSNNIANVNVLDGATMLLSTGMTLATGDYGTVPALAVVKSGASSRTITVNVTLNASFAAAGAWVQCQRGNLTVTDVGEDGQVSTPTTIVPPDMWNAAWGVVANAVSTRATNSIAATLTDVLDLLVTFTPVLGRRYEVVSEVILVGDTAGQSVIVQIRDGSNGVLQSGQGQIPIATSGIEHILIAQVTPASAAALTYKVSAQRTLGAGTFQCYGDSINIQRLYVKDVGPASPIAPSNWPPKPNPGPWTRVTYQNAWADAPGWQPLGYRINGDRVELRGDAYNGTAGVPIFTLPVGARPPSAFAVAPGVSPTAVVQFNGDGTVTSTIAAHLSINTSFSTTP